MPSEHLAAPGVALAHEHGADSAPLGGNVEAADAREQRDVRHSPMRSHEPSVDALALRDLALGAQHEFFGGPAVGHSRTSSDGLTGLPSIFMKNSHRSWPSGTWNSVNVCTGDVGTAL